MCSHLHCRGGLNPPHPRKPFLWTHPFAKVISFFYKNASHFARILPCSHFLELLDWVFMLIWTSSLASSLASEMVATASFKTSLVMLTFPLSPFPSCFFIFPSVASSFASCASFSLKAGFVRYFMPFTFSSASS